MAAPFPPRTHGPPPPAPGPFGPPMMPNMYPAPGPKKRQYSLGEVLAFFVIALPIVLIIGNLVVQLLDRDLPRGDDPTPPPTESTPATDSPTPAPPSWWQRNRSTIIGLGVSAFVFVGLITWIRRNGGLEALTSRAKGMLTRNGGDGSNPPPGLFSFFNRKPKNDEGDSSTPLSEDPPPSDKKGKKSKKGKKDEPEEEELQEEAEEEEQKSTLDSAAEAIGRIFTGGSKAPELPNLEFDPGMYDGTNLLGLAGHFPYKGKLEARGPLRRNREWAKALGEYLSMLYSIQTMEYADDTQGVADEIAKAKLKLAELKEMRDQLGHQMDLYFPTIIDDESNKDSYIFQGVPAKQLPGLIDLMKLDSRAKNHGNRGDAPGFAKTKLTKNDVNQHESKINAIFTGLENKGASNPLTHFLKSSNPRAQFWAVVSRYLGVRTERMVLRAVATGDTNALKAFADAKIDRRADEQRFNALMMKIAKSKKTWAEKESDIAKARELFAQQRAETHNSIREAMNAKKGGGGGWSFFS